ncbi:MAG TPA: carboxylating nicotinate-nucleotide diphosphorylase [Candidatus Saccharimonadales bacterium]|nr:carboxylating nicotinate-nucleotide diphosphorylase [Candidatus Saccharimonadales bacterium]
MNGRTREEERALLRAHVAAALAEDGAGHDLTSAVGLPPGARGTAVVVAGAAGVLAGTEAAGLAFRLRSPYLRVARLRRDGARVRRGTPVLRVSGPAAAVLSAERTALNYLGHLSGIATLTARCVAGLRGTRVTLLDTRKTTPLLRVLEKAAVRAGGGANHRMGLHDAVLLKDNHVRAAGGPAAAVARARAGLERLGRPRVMLELEVQSLAELRAAVGLPVDRIMLDNFPLAQLRPALALLARVPRRRRPQVEVSGGITLAGIRRHALSGVDFISAGALTHSAPALPFSLDWLR